jgi:nucleoside-diphosphate-sugar epimerase
MKPRALLTNESSSRKEVPMGELSLVVGAGVIGSRVAGMLAERGDRVRVVSRHGSGPAGVAADAADAGVMARLASGAVLVTLSNLYGYGPRVPGGYDEAHPITEATPLAATGRKGRVRARVWQDALAAHQAGRVRVAEVRAADFVGPGAQSAMGERIVRHVRQGKNVSVLGRADRPHTWSFTDDVARMLVTAGTDPRAWGRAWHVPSNEPLSQRQVIDDFARAAGVGQVRVGAIRSVVVRGMGLFWPLMRELRETEYQFRDDFVMDSSAAQATFGLKPAPWEEIVAVTVNSFSR